MAYKLVLMGIWYHGEEPSIYPDCEHPEEDFCECEQSVANAVETVFSKNHPNLEFVDVGFDSEPNKWGKWAWKRWTKPHFREVYRHYLWKIFVRLYK